MSYHARRCATREAMLFVALVSLGAALHALADDPPAFPQPDFTELAPASFIEVTRADRLVVLQGSERTELDLIGVRLPTRAGERAACEAALRRLLAGESVYVVEVLPPEETTDEDSESYNSLDSGLLHAYVYRAPDGLFVNLELIRQGYARVDSARPHAHHKLLRYYERVARQAEKGIWSPRPNAGVRNGSESTETTAHASDSSSDNSNVANGETIVYVTRTGRKYHRDDCSSLRSSKKAISLSEAIARHFEPCKRCHPPVPQDYQDP